MDLERIYNKLEEIDNKLSKAVERIAVTEEKHSSMSGQIKIIYTLILAGITSFIAAISNKFFH